MSPLPRGDDPFYKTGRDMPTFKLDGKSIPFEPGESIIRAAEKAGVEIPHYCYHPGLSAPANCRMCLVELPPPAGRPGYGVTRRPDPDPTRGRMTPAPDEYPKPLRLEWVTPDSVAENPRNWRRHPELQKEALGASLDECGWAGAMLYNETTGRLVDGHARREQALTETTTMDMHPFDETMIQPVFEPARLPFDPSGLTPRLVNGFELWPLDLGDYAAEVAVLSMGNPHAVQRVDDVDRAPVAAVGPQVEAHARFPRKVNAGFLQVQARDRVRLRVYERGAGETLACGTGACAAVVAGIRLGWLDRQVEVGTRGGQLLIEWPADDASVQMTGPAETVFEGEIEL